MNANLFAPGYCRGPGCFYTLSISPTDTSRNIKKCQMGLEKVILVQGREPKLRTLLKLGPGEKGLEDSMIPKVAKKHRKATCLLQRPGRENQNKKT